MQLLAICIFSLKKFLLRFFAHLKIGLFVFIELWESFIYFGYKSLMRFDLQIFFPILWIFLLLLDGREPKYLILFKQSSKKLAISFTKGKKIFNR